MGSDEIRQKLERHRSRVSESLSDTGSTGDSKQANGQLNRQISQDSTGSLRRRTPDKEERKTVKGEKLIEVEKTETGSVSLIFYSVCKYSYYSQWNYNLFLFYMIYRSNGPYIHIT